MQYPVDFESFEMIEVRIVQCGRVANGLATVRAASRSPRRRQ